MKKARVYQREFLKFTKTVNNPGIGMETRMGKVLSAVWTVNRWESYPVLVIAPFSAMDGWEDDLTDEGKSFVLLVGNKARRSMLLKTKNPQYFIANKEIYRVCPDIREYPWKTVIFDESDSLANNTSTTKFYLVNFRNVDHRMVLSGTPDYRNGMDYINQLYFLSKDTLPGKNYWEFRAKKCELKNQYTWGIKAKYKQEFQGIIAKNFFIAKRKDYNLGREMVYKKYMLQLPPAVQKTYTKLEEEYVLEFENVETQSSTFAIDVYSTMSQLLGGFIGQKLVWDGKLKALKNLLFKDFRDEPVVIYCSHIAEIIEISNYLNDDFHVIIHHGGMNQTTRKWVRKKFQEGGYQILIAQPESIQYGVKLHRARTIINFTPARGKKIRDQCCDRIQTLDDKDICLVIDFLVKNTIEEYQHTAMKLHGLQRTIFEAVIKKIKQQNQLSFS